MKFARTLYKDIFASFAKSKGRFLSIFLLMMIGSFALVGLKAVRPNIERALSRYFKTNHTMQFAVLSEYGISAADVQELNTLYPQASVEYGYFTDVAIRDTYYSLRLFSTPQDISQFRLVEGQLPKSEQEIALNENWTATYQIGDTIQFDNLETLTRSTFTVSGFVAASEMISNQFFGTSTTGTGTLDGYGVVLPAVFDTPVYTIARIVEHDLAKEAPFSNGYTQKSADYQKMLEQLVQNNGEERFNALHEQGTKQIEQAKQQIADAEQQLVTTQQQLTTAKEQLDQQQQTLQQAEQQLNDKQQTLQSANEQLLAGEQQLVTTQQQLQQAKNQLTSGQQTLASQQQQFTQAKQQLDAGSDELQQTKHQLEQTKQQLDEQTVALEQLKQTVLEQQHQLEQQGEDPLTNQEFIRLQEQLATQEQQLTATTQRYTNGHQLYESSVQEWQQKQHELQVVEQKLIAAQMLLNEQQKMYQNSTNQYENGYAQLIEKQYDYTQGLAQFQSAQTTIATNRAKLMNAYQELATNQATFEQKHAEATDEITAAKEQLTESKEKLDQLTMPNYTVHTRRTVPGGQGYTAIMTSALSIDSIGNIFPVVLYMVAALVTMTTITRFVHEERTRAGILKALGYQNKDIYKKFILYGLTAGLTGAIAGAIAGTYVLPDILMKGLFANAPIPDVRYEFYWDTVLIAIAIATLCSTLPAYWIARRELREQASQLLIPKVPSQHARILLERLPFIWKKLSFTQKVTIRNIFRFKQRMLMTVFSVAGSIALLYAGLGLTSSLAGIAPRQFNQLTTYDALLVQAANVNADEEDQLHQLLQTAEITQQQAIYASSFEQVIAPNKDAQTIQLLVTERAHFEPLIMLYDVQSKQSLTLPEEGAILSEKIAKELNVKAGDTLTITLNEQTYTVPIRHIAEMYVGHYLLMSKTAYQRLVQAEHPITPNAYLLDFREETTVEQIKQLTANWMALDSVIAVSQNYTLKERIAEIVTSLTSAMHLLTIVSIALAIVILYNLTTINLTERVRELATVKVLGFLPAEVTLYIYRETILLSLIGIAVGLGLGHILHQSLLTLVAPDTIQFNPAVDASVYITPIVTVCSILIALGWLVHRSLSRLDMLDALKSVE